MDARAKTRLSPRLIRFAAVGASGVFVNLGALALLSDGLDLPDTPSAAAAIELSILWNFALNNAWTFQDRNAAARAGLLGRALSYNLLALVGLAIQLGCFVGMNSLLVHLLQLAEPGPWKYLSSLCGIALAMGWNFLSNFYLTWSQRPTERPWPPSA